jgi:catechol 2,3-dioxygenase-like lactoylglutathione lyase family enzyme
VPDLQVTDVARANRLYADLFDLEVNMDLGWVGNIGPAADGAVELQVMTQDAGAPCRPLVSIGMANASEVDEVHARAVAAGLEIVHPPTDEAWGVHRFFFRDPDGHVVNVVAHP